MLPLASRARLMDHPPVPSGDFPRRMLRVVVCTVAVACAGDVADPHPPGVAAFDGRVLMDEVRRLRDVAGEPAIAALGRLLDASIDTPAPAAAVPFPGIPDTLFVGSFRNVLGRTFVRDESADRYAVRNDRREAPGDGVAFVLYEPGTGARSAGETGVFVASGLEHGPALVFDWDHLVGRIVPGDWRLAVLRERRALLEFDYDERFEVIGGAFGNLRTHRGILGAGGDRVSFVSRHFRPAPVVEGAVPVATWSVEFADTASGFRVDVEGAMRGAAPLPPTAVEAMLPGTAVRMERLDECLESGCSAVWRRFSVAVNGTLLGSVSRSASGVFEVAGFGPEAPVDDPRVPIVVLGPDQLAALSQLQTLGGETPVLIGALRAAVGTLLGLVVSCDPYAPDVCGA